MTEDDVAAACQGLTGVAGAHVEDVAKNGVRYFYSEWHVARNPDEVKKQALEFHLVNQKILEHATLIPFRFPTSVANQAELAHLMERQSSDYSQDLVRLRNLVQVKVSVKGSSHANATASSGTEYLKQRQLANAPMVEAIDEVKRAVSPLIGDTIQTRRGNGVTLFFLVERSRFPELANKLKELSALAAPITFSGPWPPSEFVNCYPAGSQQRAKSNEKTRSSHARCSRGRGRRSQEATSSCHLRRPATH